VIIGTAGHIDHGKSALVRALTGQEMDRLAEERRRGITIDLNFAPLRLEGLPPTGVVDVPGHEDFVRTMVAGASGVDLVLLVVDAAEGPMPQTLEHLAIVEQLGVPAGIPVFTKCDLVDPEWLDLIESEFAPRLAASAVRFGEPARVSALTGEGVDALRDRLRDAVAATPARKPADRLRMPIDRAFSLAGVGTVLTGTNWSGLVSVGDAVRLLPSGLEGRVRSVSSHGAALDRGGPATRIAVGVAGLDRGAVHRGEVLVHADAPWRITGALDVMLRLLPDAPRPVAARTRLRLHLGTTEVLARAHPRETIPPGGEGLVRLSLEAPLLARGGDRIVLRSYSPVTTIGGAVVVDPLPPRRAGWPEGLRETAPGARLLALLARRPQGIEDTELAQVLGLPPAESTRVADRTVGVRMVGGQWVDSERVRRLEAAALERLGVHHEVSPAEPGLSLGTLRQGLKGTEGMVRVALEAIQKRGEVIVVEGIARLAGFRAQVPGGDPVLDRIEALVAEAGLMPPTNAEIERAVGESPIEPALRLLVRAGRLEPVEPDRHYAPVALEQFSDAVREIATETGEVTPAALRDRLGLTRKYLIPLLEWSDRKGHTRREGDRRVLVKKR